MRVRQRLSKTTARRAGSVLKSAARAARLVSAIELYRGRLKSAPPPLWMSDLVLALSVLRISPEERLWRSLSAASLIATTFQDHGGARPAIPGSPVRFARKPEQRCQPLSVRLAVCPNAYARRDDRPFPAHLLVRPLCQPRAQARWGHVHPGSWICPQGWSFTAWLLDYEKGTSAC
ncbi:Hypothetical protein NGAL_HAMBI490_02450 [Neorhizobium galegae bv. officinalis]|nr:Hypothetical protein NGAL_HAMBI490_02450 [Neorhizobium galegae bv. officinalis]